MRLDTTQHEEKNGCNLAIVQVDEGEILNVIATQLAVRQIRFQNYVG